MVLKGTGALFHYSFAICRSVSSSYRQAIEGYYLDAYELVGGIGRVIAIASGCVLRRGIGLSCRVGIVATNDFKHQTCPITGRKV